MTSIDPHGTNMTLYKYKLRIKAPIRTKSKVNTYPFIYIKGYEKEKKIS